MPYGRTSRMVSRRRKPTNRQRVAGNRTNRVPTRRTSTVNGNVRRSVTPSNRRNVQSRVVNGRAQSPRGVRRIPTRFGNRPNNVRRNIVRNRTLNRTNSGRNMVCAGQLMNCPTNHCTGDCVTVAPNRQSMIK